MTSPQIDSPMHVTTTNTTSSDQLLSSVCSARVATAVTSMNAPVSTGYSTAVFARLAKSVIGLESNPALAAEAARNLSALGAANATVVTGPLEAGHPAAAPYDVILLGGAIEVVPDTLFDQLTEGGRLVAVVGYGMAAVAMLFTRTEGKVGGRPAMGWSDYRTPVDGLYLCGSGAHPGGGVMGVPGHNAANAIASDLAGVPRERTRHTGPQGRSSIDRLMARPRMRRAMVKAAQQPALAPIVERVSRRR